MELNQKRAQDIIMALDKLGLALANYSHQWADEERKAYEKAISVLTSISSADCREVDSSVLATV